MPDGDRSILFDGLRMPIGIPGVRGKSPFLPTPEAKATGETIGDPLNRTGEHP